MNKSDITRDFCMLKGPLAKKGVRLVVAFLYRRACQNRGTKIFLHRIFSVQPRLGAAGTGAGLA